MTRILVGTDDGILEFSPHGHLGGVHHPGREVSALAPEGPELWTVLDGGEVHRTTEGQWQPAGILEGLRANCIADTRAGVVIGTSEAHLSRVEGGGVAPVDSFD